MELKFSLVLATLGRQMDVDRFLSSLERQTYAKDLIEVLIVDQNEGPLLDEIIKNHAQNIKIVHIRSNQRGLSLNRNIGIKQSTGDIVCFPDDDCEYASTTLETVASTLQSGSLDFVLGRIWDKKENIPSIKKWPKTKKKITVLNFYRMSSSITLFTKRNGLLFDQKFGVGAEFGSNEDAIYIYTMLRVKKNGMFTPDIVVFHDHQALSKIPPQKVASYSFGFGRFIKTYFALATLFLFILSISFHTSKLIVSLLRYDKAEIKLRAISIIYRLYGLIKP